MATIEELVHTMTTNANKAAQLYSLGEYEAGDHHALVAQRASDQIEAMTPERAVVHEIGVS